MEKNEVLFHQRCLRETCTYCGKLIEEEEYIQVNESEYLHNACKKEYEDKRDDLVQKMTLNLILQEESANKIPEN